MPKAPIVHTYDGMFVELPRDHVHAYIVELENAVVIVDAVLALSNAAELRAKAEALGKPLVAVLLTHGHPDHYVGLAKFADLPRYASQGTLEFAYREDRAKAAIAKHLFGDEFPDERVFPDQIVKDGDSVTFDGVTFTFTDLGPAESDSDGMWSYVHDGVTHAFVGDTVAYKCHCFFRDGHTADWLRTLDRLERELGAGSKLYIGHGQTPAPADAIAWQRGYIETWRKAVAALSSNEALEATRATQEQLIAIMKEYLPGDTTLFLLDYELGHSVPETWKQLRESAK
jgi:glyoxylase-like metal-dependent hydrolase (beta-lactamase superfamily II)